MKLGCVQIVLSVVILILQCTAADGKDDWFQGLRHLDRIPPHLSDNKKLSQKDERENDGQSVYQTADSSEEDSSEEDKRFGFGGLLCCNHPPTKPPSAKRSQPGVIDENMVKSMILSNILNSILDESTDFQSPNDPDNYRLDIGQDPGDSSSSDGDDYLMLKRRGVTKRKSFTGPPNTVTFPNYQWKQLQSAG